MTVVIVKPGYAPYEADINGLDEMQKVVGGIIQAIYPFEDNAAVVCNDEGLFLDLPFNPQCAWRIWRCVRELFRLRLR